MGDRYRNENANIFLRWETLNSLISAWENTKTPSHAKFMKVRAEHLDFSIIKNFKIVLAGKGDPATLTFCRNNTYQHDSEDSTEF